MEGRLGRASSRYGPTAAVFNGPVRRWKKMWVHVARSSPSTVSYDHTAQSNGQNTLLLRRWTPTSVSGDDAAGISPDEPPRRKFRYTPIAVLEDHKKVSEEKVKPETSDQSPASESNDDVKKETMGIEKNGSPSDLELGLENDEIATTGENNIIDDLF